MSGVIIVYLILMIILLKENIIVMKLGNLNLKIIY